ncbi:hypothetical protein ACFLTH_07290 [Bacteroidota bacterium]
MKESDLLKAALITAVIGVIGLFFVMQYTELEETNISDLDSMNEDEEVRIIGTVEDVRKLNNITIISVSQKVIVKAVVFEEVDISTGEKIEVTGELKDYNGEKEITVENLAKSI